MGVQSVHTFLRRGHSGRVGSAGQAVRHSRFIVGCQSRSARRGQAGFSLIEILVGIVVMVPLTLASVSGVVLQTRLSASARQNQSLEVRLTSVTEDLAAVPFLSCAEPEKYQEALRSWNEELGVKVVSKGNEPVAKIDSVEYWDGQRATFSPKCNGADAAQRLTVTVIGTGGATATGTVVKRDDAARSAVPR